MRLNDLASLMKLSRIDGDGHTQLTGVQIDSRKVKAGDLFICLQGHRYDGHHFAKHAEQMGACALVVQRNIDSDLPKLVVKDTRFAMAVIANAFYHYPSWELKVIGVTGTNGKTSTTYLLEKILKDSQYQTGLMGTIRMKIGNQTFDITNTTLESLDLQCNIRRMKDTGAQYCLMEVSSHALALGRVKGTRFRTAIFTNLTQDHLDYHGTMERYRDAKGLLFSRLGNTFSGAEDEFQYAVLNADDQASQLYASLTCAQVITYGIHNAADVKAESIKVTSSGTGFRLSSFAGEEQFQLKMVGFFNVYNVLAATAAALAEGIPLAQIRKSVEGLEGVEGRFEPIHEGQDFLLIVDYAHTPDSLENVLQTIREFAEGRVICVFGCGGDRDRTKRPIMGSIAAKYSDYIIITSDNPRSEDPQAILHEIAAGIPAAASPASYELVVNRQAAIEKAVAKASPKDVVLIAGKGHETYQEIQGIRYDFDDRLIARTALRSK